MAFARNPMTVANLGWDLQDYSQGRFILGLGSQIKPHIEKRFSMPWSQPVRRMREFVAGAARDLDVLAGRHTGCSFEGEFYTHTLMTPMFTPEPPHPYGDPKVFVAAVGERMTEMCGEVADGLLAHAFTTKRYLDEVTMPALSRGLERAGRDAQRRRGVVPGVRRDRAATRHELAAAAVGDPQADRVLRLDAGLPQACWSCTAGVTCRPSCTGCRGGASGTRWAR